MYTNLLGNRAWSNGQFMTECEDIFLQIVKEVCKGHGNIFREGGDEDGDEDAKYKKETAKTILSKTFQYFQITNLM